VLTASAFGYDEGQLRFYESNALTHLGATRLAWSSHDRALELLTPNDFMNRSFTRLDRADCLAQDRDLTTAMRHVRDVLLGLSDEQRQGIITSRTQQLLNSVPRQDRAARPVRELRELLALSGTTKG
jgi:hypothetical protein